uniref:Uncharacterized protein n=1 Tax=Arundo donax TaxID=35708 RepID=A0A0A9D156_ARUDO
MQTPVLNPSAVYPRRIVQVSVSDTCRIRDTAPHCHIRASEITILTNQGTKVASYQQQYDYKPLYPPTILASRIYRESEESKYSC